MTEKMLTVRLDEEDHRALKLYAVLQGRSVNSVVVELIRTELARNAPTGTGRSRDDFVAALYERFGIDPSSPEHNAAAERADRSVQRSGRRASDGRGKRGVA